MAAPDAGVALAVVCEKTVARLVRGNPLSARMAAARLIPCSVATFRLIPRLLNLSARRSVLNGETTPPTVFNK